MQRHSQLYIFALKKFILATNGELVLVARFADGIEVLIRLGEEETRKPRLAANSPIQCEFQ